MALRFLTGLGVGYVLGSRAGRERYEQIRDAVRQLTETDIVRQLRRDFADATGLLGPDSAGAPSALGSPPVVVGPAGAGTVGADDGS